MALFQDRRWKFWLIVAGIIVLSLSTAYSYYVTDRLKEREETTIELISLVIQDLNRIAEEDSENLDISMNVHLDVLAKNKSIPVLLVNEAGRVEGQYNFLPDDALAEDHQEELQAELQKIQTNGKEPFVVTSYLYANNPTESYIYYKNSKLIVLLSFFPLFQLLLIATFVAYGLYGIISARRAEQNRVWAGLAKETAHQLGTPISAIMAWISLLDNTLDKNDANQEILLELDKDVKRLNLIADRFSKVGSKPELKEVAINDVVDQALDYMKRRASRKVKFVYDTENIPVLMASINPPLFEWVVENLLRNALDAMDGKGNIVVDIYEENNRTCLDISDTGKGIPSGKFKAVFEPGFSTKKRGWGLGLSLAKRIIEMYHKGRIFVKESKINGGTTFTIQLPVRKSSNGI